MNDPLETAPTQTVVPRPGDATALTVVSWLLNGALLAAIVCTRGRFNRIFVDFNTKMPAITDVVRSPWFVAMVAALSGLTILGGCMLRNRAAQATWNKIAIVAVVVLGGFYVVGMFLPLVRIVNLRT